MWQNPAGTAARELCPGLQPATLQCSATCKILSQEHPINQKIVLVCHLQHSTPVLVSANGYHWPLINVYHATKPFVCLRVAAELIIYYFHCGYTRKMAVGPLKLKQNPMFSNLCTRSSNRGISSVAARAHGRILYVKRRSNKNGSWRWGGRL